MSKIEVEVLVNGKKCDKTKQQILNKLDHSRLMAINIQWRSMIKKFTKVASTPIKTREAVLEICKFLDKCPEQDLKDAKISQENIKYIREWQSVLKP